VLILSSFARKVFGYHDGQSNANHWKRSSHVRTRANLFTESDLHLMGSELLDEHDFEAWKVEIDGDRETFGFPDLGRTGSQRFTRFGTS
jgi:hypothetical protein